MIKELVLVLALVVGNAQAATEAEPQEPEVSGPSKMWVLPYKDTLLLLCSQTYTFIDKPELGVLTQCTIIRKPHVSEFVECSVVEGPPHINCYGKL